MPKKEVKIEETTTAEDPRATAWEAFLAKYEKDNPVKFAKKKDSGEFNKIPDSFK